MRTPDLFSGILLSFIVVTSTSLLPVRGGTVPHRVGCAYVENQSSHAITVHVSTDYEAELDIRPDIDGGEKWSFPAGTKAILTWNAFGPSTPYDVDEDKYIWATFPGGFYPQMTFKQDPTTRYVQKGCMSMWKGARAIATDAMWIKIFK